MEMWCRCHKCAEAGVKRGDPDTGYFAVSLDGVGKKDAFDLIDTTVCPWCGSDNWYFTYCDEGEDEQ